MTAQSLTDAEILSMPLNALMAQAAALRDREYGNIHTYSRKVFIPLTYLCRDVCAYCTFAKPPKTGEPIFLSRDEVLAIARAGAAAGCTEALFTLGERPELRYRAAREALAALGQETTIDYLAEMCQAVLEETGLLPHANPGTLTADELGAAAPRTPISQGMMLESISETAVRARRPALRFARQAPSRTAGNVGAGRGAENPLHHRHSHRHWRDA